uniref:Lymphocyte specific protein 1 a n=1 Tax=Astyanax mexicanus TaxID=7994 RepID=A0A3B1JY03_ASTMX
SIEDAEEIERERRRRARESLRKERSLTGSSGSPQDGSGPTEDYHSGLKPSSPGGLEEDEGFSDWTQRLERDRRARQEENGPREEDLEGNLETEQKLEKIRRSHQEKESQELEHLRLRQAEAEVELEELKRKREERRRVREEEERRREEEEHLRLVKEELLYAASMLRSLLHALTKCLCFGNSNSFKKTQPPVLLSKIDDRLEQYTHAVEISAKEPKTVKAAAVDMPSVPEPVTAKKNLFEAGEAWNQTTFKGTPSKNTSAGKRYKFVVTGHGKYEKISIDDDQPAAEL